MKKRAVLSFLKRYALKPLWEEPAELWGNQPLICAELPFATVKMHPEDYWGHVRVTGNLIVYPCQAMQYSASRYPFQTSSWGSLRTHSLKCEYVMGGDEQVWMARKACIMHGRATPYACSNTIARDIQKCWKITHNIFA